MEFKQNKDSELFYKKFTDFLISQKCLLFGDFTLKSGKKSPYFINTGVFSSGKAIQELGRYYAEKIVSLFKHDVDIIYGPAYKGIPLAITTTIALNENYNLNCDYLFNRKELKTHGDKGMFIGGIPSDTKNKIVIVDDVITTGDTKKESLMLLKNYFPFAEIKGVVILIDRLERVNDGKTATELLVEEFKVPVYSIATILDIINFVEQPQKEKIIKYLNKESIL